MNREPLTIVEIDVPQCTRVFGGAPCTASLSASTPRKCYNTRATCADPANYNAGVLTLRFAHNQSNLPPEATVFPALQSVSTNASQINLSGLDTSSSPLGVRARVTVNLLDFAYHDSLTDKYFAERKSGAAQIGPGYDPSRGTFFAKLMARQPYYLGWPLRVKRGYVGQAMSAMETSHYVVSEWAGPSASGAVQITAKDVLDLAENTKAVAPKVSNGKLKGNITTSTPIFTLVPAGVGAEYATSGRICIGREVATFTRSGDIVTLTGRGLDGTTAAAHKAGDTVQQCLRVDDALLSNTIRSLLVNYAGVPSSYITTSEWQAEETDWLAGLTITATITKPTGVKTLIGEICQLGVMVWSDEGAKKIRFRCNRPLAPGETIYPITDAAHIIAGSPETELNEKQRVSGLILYHGMKDPTGSATDGANFDKASVVTVSENFYGQDSIKTISTRWFGADGDDAAAGVIAERLVGRYKDTPRIFMATLDIKDRPHVDLGSLISVSSYLIQDPTGETIPTAMQVNSVEVSGDRVKIKAESYAIDGRFAFWLQDAAPTYTTATDAEKAFGAFWMDETIGTFSDGTGPYLYF